MAQQRTLTLTAAQRRELTDHRDHHPKPYVRERCAALLKIAAGQSPHAVALTGLLKPRNPDTVYQWLDWYETEGLAGLLQHQQGGHRGQGPTEIQLVELVERLRYQPDLFVEWTPEWARPELLLARGQPRPIPVRWSLKRIRASMPWLSAYTLSGIWRLLHRIGIRLRQGRPQLFSPDPQYKAKEAQLLEILAEVGANPTDKVALFLDEVSYYHWPQAARLWARLKAAVTLAGRAAPGNSQQRIVGALNAVTGQVTYQQAYKIDRRQFIRFLKKLNQLYASFKVIYIILDNWSVHHHPDVLEALKQLPRLKLVFLPTYSPWLNPIEKLWGWLKVDVLKMHRLAGRWAELKQLVGQFLDLFAPGSPELLQRVGLLADGKLARALAGP